MEEAVVSLWKKEINSRRSSSRFLNQEKTLEESVKKPLLPKKRNEDLA